MAFNLKFRDLYKTSPKFEKFWEEESDWIGNQIVQAFNRNLDYVELKLNIEYDILNYALIKLKELGYNAEIVRNAFYKEGQYYDESFIRQTF
jgi:hypothetical protein